MQRFLRLFLMGGLAVASLVAGSSALAHNVPGLKPLKPGEPFIVASLRGLIRGADGHYQRASLDFNALHDGSALAFLVFDPLTPSDVAEAKRFEKALQKLPHTHGFLVLPPGRSLLIDEMAQTLDKTGLTAATVVDNQSIFPGVFRHALKARPRYELLDRSQTLVVQNATRLGQKLPDGETIGELLTLLDEGKPVSPVVVSAEDQAQDDPRE